MTRVRLALFVALTAGIFAPVAEAQFTIDSPTTDWIAVPYGPTSLGDPKTDHQTGQGEADIVGNTGSLATSLSSFYCKFVAGTTPTNGTLNYRVRVGGDQSPAGYKSVLLVGLDANRDGKLDLFLGVDNSGQSNGLYIWKPGTGLNISPSTTSMESRTPVKKYATTLANYHWGAVDSLSATAGVVLDPTADTPLRKDFNASTGTDYLLSFSIPFADLVAALGAQGITFHSGSAVTYVMGTATQANSFNQDLNGVSGGTSSTLTWGALGVLTQPVSPSGTVINVAPVNTVSGPRTANGSLAVTGTSVNDPDGNLATVQVTATNGTLSVSLSNGAAIITGANGSANFTLGGTEAQINAALATLGYTPTTGYTGPAALTIQSTDSGGLTDVDSIELTVVSNANSVPAANPDSATTHSGKPVTAYVIGNDIDADGNVLTITSASLTSGAGTISALNGNITYTPTTSFVGSALIAYSITDGFGGTASSTLTVSVSANNAPVAVNDSVNANPNAVIFINVLANDSDANGDALTITAASRASGTGSVTIVGNELQFDAPGSNGTTTLSYTISDGFGGSSTATVTVSIGTNTAPVAVADSATTTAGSPVEVSVLANDSDANGDPLMITDAVVTSGTGTALAVNNKVRFTPTAEFTGTATITYTIDDGRGGVASAVLTVTVTGNTAPVAAAEGYSVAEDGVLSIDAAGILANDSDIDGNMLSAMLVSGVSHGALTLNSDGSFTYTPVANYHGPDAFTYQASDGSLVSNAVIVSIVVTPVNDAPVAGAESYSVLEEGTLTVNTPGVLGDDTDVDGDGLSAVLVSGVSHGTLLLNANGSFSYSPAPGYNGPDSFTYKAFDGSNDSNVVTVSITVSPVNDAPVASGESYSVSAGDALAIAEPGVLGNDSDPDGDSLTAILVSGVSHGALLLNADGSFSYSPAGGYNGPDSFDYKVSDGVAESGVATVSITVSPVNGAPVATGESFSITSGATLNVPAPGVLGNDSDPDGDPLVAVLVSNASNGTLVLNVNGSFTYTSAANFSGSDSFTYRASDSSLSSSEVTVSIDVTAPPPANRPPVLSAPTPLATNVGAPVSFSITTSDPDADPVTVTVNQPPRGIVSGTGPEYTYTPNDGFVGTDTFSIVANDGRGGVVSRTIKVVVSSIEGTVGNYALLLRNEQGDVAGHLLLTCTKMGRATGLLTLGGIRYTARGFFGGAPSVLMPRSKGSTPVTLALDADQSVPGAPALVVTATDSLGSYTGRSPRSPYSKLNPAPQAGQYTLIASRQPIVLDRVGLELPDAGQAVPMVASVLTARVLSTGAVLFKGSAAHGYPLVCSSYVMAGSNVPFYAGRRDPGGSVQYSTLLFPPDPATMSVETTAPAISGSLRWIANRDRRITEPFAADYAVLGARYTPPVEGSGLLDSPALTLSLDIPSYAAAGLPTPYEDTRSFAGNLLPPATGNVSAIRVTFASGIFIARVYGAVTRPVIGVIIQGEGINRGLGSVVDFTSLGTCELRPALPATSGEPQ